VLTCWAYDDDTVTLGYNNNNKYIALSAILPSGLNNNILFNEIKAARSIHMRTSVTQDNEKGVRANQRWAAADSCLGRQT